MTTPNLQVSVKSARRGSSVAVTDDFTFGMVGSKLVWLNFQNKVVQFVDFEQFAKSAEKAFYKVQWSSVASPWFTVRQLLQNFSREDYRLKGIAINEV